MSSIPPPSSTEEEPQAAHGAAPRARRPRYLVVALAFALVFGAGCWTEGCARLAYYRGERDHDAALNAAIHDDDARGRAEALYQRFVDVAEGARGRAIPMAAATFVLGAALLALAARGLAGKSNARSALMQVVAAQAIVVGANYFVTRDMRNAELDWQFSRSLSLQRESLPADQYRDVAATVDTLRRYAPPTWLVVRSLASVLIIVALSRPRVRQFFEESEA
jgi:hypothetical protein